MFLQTAGSASSASSAGFQIWEDDNSNNIFNNSVGAKSRISSKNSFGGFGQQTTQGLSNRKALHALAPSRKAQLDAWRQQKRGDSRAEAEASVSAGTVDENTLPSSSQPLVTRRTSQDQQATETPTPKVVPTLSAPKKLNSNRLLCSVYTRTISSSAAKWRKRGTEKGHVSFVPSLQNVVSLQVRSSTTLQLLANFSLNSTVQLLAQSSKSWTLTADDYSTDCQATRTHFMLRFSSTKDAQKFRQQFEAAQGENLDAVGTGEVAATQKVQSKETPGEVDSTSTTSALPSAPKTVPRDVYEAKCRQVETLERELANLKNQLASERTARQAIEARHQKTLERFQSVLSDAMHVEAAVEKQGL